MIPLYLIGRASDNGNRKATLDIINNRLNIDLHTKMIDYHIGLFKSMETSPEQKKEGAKF